jgi:flagellin
MTFSVNTNTNALAALQTLNATQRALAATSAHINTGFKVNDARDDASTFAIAQGMRADIAGLKAVQDSLSLGQATLSVANDAVKQIQDKLTDIQGKVVEGQNATVDRNAIQNGINALTAQITAIAGAAQFNGVNLINSSTGSFSVVSSLNRTSSTSVTVATTTIANSDLTASGNVLGLGGISILGNNAAQIDLGSAPAIADGDTIQVNLAGGTSIVFEFNDASGATTLATASSPTQTVVAVNFNSATDSVQQRLGDLMVAMRQNGLTASADDNGNVQISSGSPLTSVAVTVAGGTLTMHDMDPNTVGTQSVGSAPSAALTAINNAINSIKTVAASLGTDYNQLQGQADFVKSLTDTLTGGVSSLVDADLAAESANLQALQTKQQLGIQALSIANQSSGAVLALFR